MASPLQKLSNSFKRTPRSAAGEAGATAEVVALAADMAAGTSGDVLKDANAKSAPVGPSVKTKEVAAAAAAKATAAKQKAEPSTASQATANDGHTESGSGTNGKKKRKKKKKGSLSRLLSGSRSTDKATKATATAPASPEPAKQSTDKPANSASSRTEPADSAGSTSSAASSSEQQPESEVGPAPASEQSNGAALAQHDSPPRSSLKSPTSASSGSSGSQGSLGDKQLTEKKVSFKDLPVGEEEAAPAAPAPKAANGSKSKARPKTKINGSNESSLEEVDLGSPIQYFGLDGSLSAMAGHEYLVSVESLGASETTIFQDWLRVRSATDVTWKNRWVLVDNNVLYIFPSFDSSRPSSIVILDQVELEDCPADLGPAAPGANLFRLRTRTGRVLYLQADSSQMKDQWMELLATHNEGYQAKLRQRQVAARERRSRRARDSAAAASSTPAAMLWGIFVILQVCMQLSVEVVYFLKHGSIRADKLKARKPPSSRAAPRRVVDGAVE